MRLTTKIPIAKDKHFAPPPTMKNNGANSFLQKSRNFLLMFLLSIACELRANPSGLLQDIDISFDPENNESLVLASWQRLTKTNGQNVIFYCQQNKEDIVFIKPVDLSNTQLAIPFSSFTKNKEPFVYSLICNLRVRPESTGDIDVKGQELIQYFQVKNLYANSQYASWEVPPNINPANFIINLSSTDFDEESIVLPGDQNIWYYDYALEPGKYKLSIEIDVNNGYHYKSTTYSFNVTDKINKNGISISARQTNGTADNDHDNTGYLLYIIPSAFAGALHLVYFVAGAIIPFNCYRTSGSNSVRARFHTALSMNLFLFCIDILAIFPGVPLAYVIYLLANSESDGTDKTDGVFLKMMGGAIVFIVQSIFVPFTTLAGFSTRVLIGKYLLELFLTTNTVIDNPRYPNYALPASSVSGLSHGEPPSYEAALNMVPMLESSSPTYEP